MLSDVRMVLHPSFPSMLALSRAVLVIQCIGHIQPCNSASLFPSQWRACLGRWQKDDNECGIILKTVYTALCGGESFGIWTLSFNPNTAKVCLCPPSYHISAVFLRESLDIWCVDIVNIWVQGNKCEIYHFKCRLPKKSFNSHQNMCQRFPKVFRRFLCPFAVNSNEKWVSKSLGRVLERLS